MNKKIILPFVAIAVLAVAMVGAASAATTVNEVVIRGTVQDITTTQPDAIEWNSTNFAAFWYDLDDNLQTERLWIKANSLNCAADDRSVEKDNISYSTHPEPQQYELNKAGMLLETGVDNRTHYFIEGWLANKYVAINEKPDKLCELLFEFDGDDKRTLVAGEEWNIGRGFSLTAQQIDLVGEKVWLTLSKDDNELDSEVISTGSAAATKNDSVYTYTVDLAGEDDIPVFHCYVDAVFRGTDTNIVQIKYVFLIDDDVLEIDTGDEFGIMEATVSGRFVNLTNKDDAVDLSQDNVEHLMGDMYIRTADNADDEDNIRFYPFVEYTEPGTYEIRGTVQDITTTQPDAIEWDSINFAAFWYDLDDDLQTESLWIDANSLNCGADDRSVEKDNISYSTHPEPQQYELNKAGMLLETGVDNRTHYFIEGWLANKYVAINEKPDKLCELLFEFDGDDKRTLVAGEEWNIGRGFSLTAQQIDLVGEKVWLTLSKDDNELDSEVISTGSAAATKNDSVYTYTVDLAGEDDIPVFHCYVDAVFRGTDTNIVQIKYVFLIDDDVLEIDTGDEFGIMEATVSGRFVNLTNKDDAVDLSQDNVEHLMGDMYIRTADNADDEDNIRFYPFVELTIGDDTVVVDEGEEDTNGTVVIDDTADANVTPTAAVTPTLEDPTPTATEDTTEADDAGTEATETATEDETPGFEAIFAIAGLLAVAYLVLRQRE